MSKDSCFVSPLYFSQNQEDLFSPSSKFFLNIFFFQIPDSFADRESGWPAWVRRPRGKGESGGVQQPHLAGQWSLVYRGRVQCDNPRPNRAHHSKLGGFKSFEWFQTTLQNGENFTGSQTLPQSNYSVWPFLNHCSTPRLCLSHVLMCQESNFREELLVWIVKIQITETLRREIIFSLGWYILLPNIYRRF